MKRWIVIAGLCLATVNAKAQGEEAQQLLLNVEKLMQFKKILQNMYDGYKLLYKGYTAVKDISEGNFNLHKAFLDGLLEVSPAVRKYKRIAEIIQYQLRIAKEYKTAFASAKSSGQFTVTEITYLGSVYSKLLGESEKSLEELMMVLTAGKLRMNDDERLQAIDKIYVTVVDQFSFLTIFSSHARLLTVQRQAEQTAVRLSRIISGVK